MLSWIPEEPPVPPEQRGRGRLSLRYEDISQDGFLLMEALPTALGELWRRLDGAQRASLGSERGVLPILSRVVIEGGEGPVSVSNAAATSGAYHLAHTRGADGEVDRIILAMWSEVTSTIGRTQGRQPEDAGRPVVAGRVFAEHVFTRPFAPPDQRKVRALQIDGGAVVPPDAWAYRDAKATLDLPEGAVARDFTLRPGGAITVFGLDHTDSNQHVNSLVYTRLFIEAALRSFHGYGADASRRRCRTIEIAYRKPSFAGEPVRICSRAFELDGEPGMVATLIAAGDDSMVEEAMRPRVYARMLFTR